MRPLRLLGPMLIGFVVACGEGRIRQPPPPPPPPPTGGATLQLDLRGYARPYIVDNQVAASGQHFLTVAVDVVNPTGTAQAVSWEQFSVETDAGVHRVSDRTARRPAACNISLQGNARTNCALVFEISASSQPAQLIFHGAGGDVRTSFDGVDGPPALCPVLGLEHDANACRDGCNNDGDAFVDCDDADCCLVRLDCPAGTHCGGAPVECVMGVEGTVSGCRDSCDNDEDTYTDCDDFDCCDLVACGAGTQCATRPDPFVDPVSFDEATLAATNPSTLLAGPAPCRAPALVRVVFVRDGDTVEVEPLQPGGPTGPVRLIGIDTPELARQGMPAECHSVEASEFTWNLVNQTVWLTFDAVCRDQFDRHLAYLHYGPHRSQLWARQLLRRGLATRFGFEGNDGLGEWLENDEALARAQGRGLWTACP